MAERLRIRPARIDECESLADLARRSKASWGYDAGFMRACHDELGVSTVAVAAGSVFVAEWGGVVVGVHALEAANGDDEVELGLLFVEPAYLRRGFGAALLHHALATARARGYRRLLIQGDPHAAGFYRALGAVPVGERVSASIPGRVLPLFEMLLPGEPG